MTESSYALSVRNGDATLHIRGGDYDEFYTNALVALGPRLDNLLAGFGGGVTEQQAVQNVADAGMLPPQQDAPPPPPQAPSAPPPPPPPPATPQAPQQQAQPQQAQPQQDDAWKSNAPDCQHGRMAPRSGTNRNGEPYKAYFCPLPKERRAEQCKPIFLDD